MKKPGLVLERVKKHSGERDKVLVTSFFHIPHHFLLLKGKYHLYMFKSLQNNKNVDLSKLKALAEDIFHVTQKVNLDIYRVENIPGKGQNATYQHLLLFLQCGKWPICHAGKKINLTLCHTSQLLTTLGKKPFSNHCGKRINCW